MRVRLAPGKTRRGPRCGNTATLAQHVWAGARAGRNTTKEQAHHGCDQRNRSRRPNRRHHPEHHHLPPHHMEGCGRSGRPVRPHLAPGRGAWRHKVLAADIQIFRTALPAADHIRQRRIHAGRHARRRHLHPSGRRTPATRRNRRRRRHGRHRTPDPHESGSVQAPRHGEERVRAGTRSRTRKQSQRNHTGRAGTVRRQPGRARTRRGRRPVEAHAAIPGRMGRGRVLPAHRFRLRCELLRPQGPGTHRGTPGRHSDRGRQGA